MDPKFIQLEIRLLLSSLRLFVAKIPINKQPRAMNKLQLTTKNLDPTLDQNSLKSVLQDLQFQANFLKLTNPNVQFQSTKVVDEETDKFIQDQQNSKEAESKKEEELNPLNKTGTYILVDGKLVEGKADRKVKVDYTNWHAGNVDPDDLKKHKELLDRQHFRGPFWDGKPMPKSVLNDQNPFSQVYSDEPPQGEVNPSLTQPKQQNWEKVKR